MRRLKREKNPAEMISASLGHIRRLMKISHFCIDRPVFASVLSIVITLAGGVALYNLPIAQYPDIAPVEISVTATYPALPQKSPRKMSPPLSSST